MKIQKYEMVLEDSGVFCMLLKKSGVLAGLSGPTSPFIVGWARWTVGCVIRCGVEGVRKYFRKDSRKSKMSIEMQVMKTRHWTGSGNVKLQEAGIGAHI